jgi:hypothetical protein
MKRLIIGFIAVTMVVSLTLLLCGSPVSAYVSPVTTDLWDLSKGAQVTYTTGVYYDSDIRNMFGGTYGSLEGGDRTLFKDGMSLGYAHVVEWKTSTPILLTGFNLIAAHDGDGRNIYYRGFRDFVLQSKIGAAWMTIYSCQIEDDTYNPKLIDNRPYNELALFVTGLNVTTQNFRAEFGQAGNVGGAQGPRIIEFDGFGTPVPIPPSVWLLGSGLVGLVGLRRKLRSI